MYRLLEFSFLKYMYIKHVVTRDKIVSRTEIYHRLSKKDLHWNQSRFVSIPNKIGKNGEGESRLSTAQ